MTNRQVIRAASVKRLLPTKRIARLKSYPAQERHAHRLCLRKFKIKLARSVQTFTMPRNLRTATPNEVREALGGRR